MCLTVRLGLFLLVTACLGQGTMAGKRSEFLRITEPSKRVLNLRTHIEKTCTESKSRDGDGIEVEIRYPAMCEGGSERFLSALDAVVRAVANRTRPIARKSKVIGFLLENKDLPPNIKYAHRSREPETAELFLLKGCSEQQWWEDVSLIRTLQLHTSHELFHVFAGKAATKAGLPRWLEEGMADYVAHKVAASLAPEVAERSLARRLPLATFVSASDSDVAEAISGKGSATGTPESFEWDRWRYALYHGALLWSERLRGSPEERLIAALRDNTSRRAALARIVLGEDVAVLHAASAKFKQDIVREERAILTAATRTSRLGLALGRLGALGECADDLAPLDLVGSWPCRDVAGFVGYTTNCGTVRLLRDTLHRLQECQSRKRDVLAIAERLVDEGDEAAVDVLIGLLESSNAYTGHRIVEVLEQASGQSFDDDLSDGPQVRREAARRWREWWETTRAARSIQPLEP